MNWRLGPGWNLGNRHAVDNARVAALEMTQRRVEREGVEIFLAERAAAAACATGSAYDANEGARCPNPAPAALSATRLTA